MKKHFVTFLSPGTFVHETTERPIESHDVEEAKRLAHGIEERHGAIPFAFYFTTRERGDNDLDSKQCYQSPTYYLGGYVWTVEDIEKRDDRDYKTLLSNMRCNKWETVVENKNSWTIFQPLMPGDRVLKWKPEQNAK